MILKNVKIIAMELVLGSLGAQTSIFVSSLWRVWSWKSANFYKLSNIVLL